VNFEPSTSMLSLSSAALAAPLKPVTFEPPATAQAFGGPIWSSAPEPSRPFGPVLIVLASAAIHVLLASWLSSARAHEGRAFKLPRHVRITVARPPSPPKPVAVPVAVAPPPKPPVVPVIRKKLAPVSPSEQPKPETPAPEPVLATTEATEPGAVIGSAQGSVEGTGVVGGVKGGTGVAVVPPSPPPAPIIQAHEGAGYLRNPRPPYPEIARARGWEGEVLLKVRVAASGRAEAMAIKRSSGRHLLDDAAVEAVKGWTFVPAMQGGVAVAGWVDVPLLFRLQ